MVSYPAMGAYVHDGQNLSAPRLCGCHCWTMDNTGRPLTIDNNKETTLTPLPQPLHSSARTSKRPKTPLDRYRSHQVITMSRRPPPGQDRSEQNRSTLKSLVKLESNKSCADCKRNKHPRWASWNLGIFICIRCSGIHRGMGTHISRVKSVDLDTWTDEQLGMMLKWGNSRANK